MYRAKPILLGVVGVLVIIYSLDCFSMVLADDQAMECCSKMPCMPSHSSHSCCKTTAAGHSPYVQSPAGPSIGIVAVALDAPLAVAIPAACESHRRAVEASEHAPPGFPTSLRLPLLI